MALDDTASRTEAAADGSALSEDARLLAAHAAGDPAAAARLIDRHAPRVLSLATRMLGDREEAEDVTQEAMLRLWQKAPDWQDGRGAVGTWLYRVALNLCHDRLRARKRRGGPQPALDTIPEPASEEAGPEEALLLAERAASLQRALDRLPERQRAAFLLRHLEGLGNGEIATLLETSIEAVESLTARARRGLVALLAPSTGESR